MPQHPDRIINVARLEVSSERAQEYHEHFAAEIGDLAADGLEISATYNLFPWLESTVNPLLTHPDLYTEFLAAKNDIAAIVMVDVNPLDSESVDPALHSRRAILLETNSGHRAIVTVTRYGQGEWGNFGGAGIYHHQDGSRLGHSVHHSETLALIMTEKSYAIGTEKELRGSKTVIDSTDWLQDPTLQFITGMLFSPHGPFPKVFTGSDAGQTPETIDRMYRGSLAAGGGKGEIVGTKDGLPNTAGYCRYTMLATYETLRDYHELPKITGSIVAIQGLGKIGLTTAEAMLDQGASIIYIADVADITNRVHDLRQRAQEFGRDQQIVVVSPEEIYDQPANIFCPCSTAEGVIDTDKIDRLRASGVRVILSGANGPLQSLAVAQYAQNQGIVVPHETVSNGGSATAAALEALEYLPHQDQWQGNAEAFVQAVLVPHIYSTVLQRLSEAEQIARNQEVTLYEASIIATQRWLANHA